MTTNHSAMIKAIATNKCQDHKKAADIISQQSNIFENAICELYNQRAKLSFITQEGWIKYFLNYYIEVESGVMSSENEFSHSINSEKYGPVSPVEFLELSERERIDIFSKHIEDRVQNLSPHYYPIQTAIDELKISHCNRLEDISFKQIPMQYSDTYIKLTWLGYGNDLEYGRQYEMILVNASQINMHTHASQILDRLNKRDAKREQLREAGLQPDRPLAGLLRDAGKTTEDLFEAAKAHGFAGSRKWHMSGPGPMVFAGRKLSLKFRDGKIVSTFSLSDKVSWGRGTLKLESLVLPEALIMQARGKLLRQLVDHPWLDGLQVTHAAIAKNREGNQIVSFMTKEV